MGSRGRVAVHHQLSARLWGNVLWLISGSGVRLFLSGLYFLLLTRRLGPEGFGLFSGILACSTLLGPLAYMGQPQLLSQRLSRDPQDTQQLWGRAWLITIGLGSIVALILWVPLWIWLPESPFLAVGLILMSELVIGGLQYGVKGVLIAHERLGWVAMIDTAMALMRVLAVALAWIWGIETLGPWAWLYAVILLGVGILTQVSLTPILGTPKLSWPQCRRHSLLPAEWLAQIKDGWPFAIGGIAILAFMDLDKLLLPRLATAAEAGAYGAAYRLILFAQIPIMAVMTSSFAEVCRQGSQGLRQGLRYGTRLAPWVLGYGAGAAVAVGWGAGVVPMVLGEEYRETAVILRWLSGVIFLEGIHLLLSEILAGADRLLWRSRIQLMALGVNGLLNLIWIPVWGWRGAAAATVLAEGGLILGLGIYVIGCLQQEPLISPAVMAPESSHGR